MTYEKIKPIPMGTTFTQIEKARTLMANCNYCIHYDGKGECEKYGRLLDTSHDCSYFVKCNQIDKTCKSGYIQYEEEGKNEIIEKYFTSGGETTKISATKRDKETYHKCNTCAYEHSDCKGNKSAEYQKCPYYKTPKYSSNPEKEIAELKKENEKLLRKNIELVKLYTDIIDCFVRRFE